MTDKKLIDEEIIKRLERCVNRGNRNYNTDIVLDLINRQKSEIERLKTENKIYIEANRVIGYQRDQRDKEIDELQNQIDGLDVRENKIKAEAYKEFAKFLIDKASKGLIHVSELPDFVKGMVGDGE